MRLRTLFDEPPSLDWQRLPDESGPKVRWQRDIYYTAPDRLVLEKKSVKFTLANLTNKPVFLSSCVPWAAVGHVSVGAGAGSCGSGKPFYDPCDGIGDSFEGCYHDDCFGGTEELEPGGVASWGWGNQSSKDIEGQGCCRRLGPPAPAGDYLVSVQYESDGECLEQTATFHYPETDLVELEIQPK